MRETRRVLRMLEKRLGEINGEAEMLDQERRRLETAIEVVHDIEQEAGEGSHKRGEVRAAVRQGLNRNGPRRAPKSSRRPAPTEWWSTARCSAWSTRTRSHATGGCTTFASRGYPPTTPEGRAPPVAESETAETETERRHKWGECEKCHAKLPPTGAFIGFFGKQDEFPLWCRRCVVRDGDPELLALWDEAVSAETERRAEYRAKQTERKARAAAKQGRRTKPGRGTPAQERRGINGPRENEG